jgi:PhnB protein
MKLNPYLNFNGDCEVAFLFYQKCFRGQIVAMIKTRDTPMAERMPADAQDTVMHARLEVGGTVLMGSDAMQHYRKAEGINVTLNIPDAAEADRVFHELAEGGSVTMPIQETFWAERFGSVTDRFGIPWMINCEKPMG